MATLFVSGNRTFAQPGIDGGEFSVGGGIGSTTNVVIIARMRDVETAWIQVVQSAGTTPTLGTAPNSPIFSRFNTLTSSGIFIPASQTSGATTYDWGMLGIGG